MTFHPIVLRGGRRVKAYLEQAPDAPPTYREWAQLVHGATLIVEGKQSDLACVADWLSRAKRALDAERRR